MFRDVCLNLSFKDISTSPLKTINTIFIQDAHLDYHNEGESNNNTENLSKDEKNVADLFKLCD